MLGVKKSKCDTVGKYINENINLKETINRKPKKIIMRDKERMIKKTDPRIYLINTIEES